MMDLITEKLHISQFKPYLLPRARNAHKGMFGHVCVIGGEYGYSGAVRMAGEAALRMGAGLVSVGTRPEHALVLNISCPVLMCHGIKTRKDLEKLLQKSSVVVVGPGLGQTAWSKKLWDVCIKSKKNLIVDADGLNILAKHPQKNPHWILTPHMGEAARLLKTNVSDIENDRHQAIKALQKKFNGIVILKGEGTLIYDGTSLAVCQAGNPGLASGGTGDVLSGVLGSLVAQHILPSVAAKMGVLIHAMAGDLAAKNLGERGMIATDLYPYLRQLMNTHDQSYL